MKKIFVVSISLFIITVCQFASGQNLSTTIKVQAMDMATAFMKNDFTSFIKYMHPNIIAYVGGKEKMKTAMDSAHEAMKLFGVNFKRYWIGDPGAIVDYKGQLQAVLPESTIMNTPLGELTAETSMIVISPDKGKSWGLISGKMFFNLSNLYTFVSMNHQLFPLSGEMTIIEVSAVSSPNGVFMIVLSGNTACSCPL